MAQCRLTERIRIEKLAGRIKDEEGNIQDNFEEYYTCWANFKALSGKKFAEQQGTQYIRKDSFIIRYCKKVSAIIDAQDLEDFRIVYKGKIYKIIYPYDIKNEHEYVDLECEIVE